MLFQRFERRLDRLTGMDMCLPGVPFGTDGRRQFFFGTAKACPVPLAFSHLGTPLIKLDSVRRQIFHNIGLIEMFLTPLPEFGLAL